MKTLAILGTQSNTPISSMPLDYLPQDAKPQWFTISDGIDKGKRLFYYDIVIGEGQPESTLFFVHGNPESCYTYKKTVDEVVKKSTKAVRIIAMDHIGFGLSDQASFEMVDMHHAANLKQLIAYLDINNVTLVIHDWGGAIGIGSFIDTPELVTNLVLMNTTVFPMPKTGITYQNFPFAGILSWTQLGHFFPAKWWRFIPPLVMTSPAGKGAFVKHVFKFAYRALFNKLNDKECFYRDSFKTVNNAKSSMRNVKQTGVWGHGYRYYDISQGWQDNHHFYQNIQAKINQVWGTEGQNIGVKAYFGLYDPCAKHEVQQQWLKALPQLQNHINLYPQRGHFIEEFEYEAIANGIAEVAGLVEIN